MPGAMNKYLRWTVLCTSSITILFDNITHYHEMKSFLSPCVKLEVFFLIFSLEISHHC